MSAFFDPSQFTAPKAKPLPVILLLDTSSSMDMVTNPDEVRRTGRYDVEDGRDIEYVEGGITRIQILNDAVCKMLTTLAKEEKNETEFLLSIITFGEHTGLVCGPASVADTHFTDLEADGMTPLGAALDIAKSLIEDKDKTPSRAYRPLVVLVSDGEPNDSGWEHKLSDFIHNGRSAKCDRMALAISAEADRGMLARFVEGTGHDVFEANAADEIHKFFKFVTMSVVTRSLSKNPNEVPKDKTLTPPSQSENAKSQTASSVSSSEEESYW